MVACGSGTDLDQLLWLKLDGSELVKCFNAAGSLKEFLPISNFLCSLLAYALRTLNDAHASVGPSIVVVVECHKQTVRVLKFVLRACSNALAYKIKHAIVLESESFLEQQRINFDLAMENYAFKITVCSRTKLWKHVKRAHIIQNNDMLKSWEDLKEDFEQHFFSNPVYFGRDGMKCVKSLISFLKKETSVVIQLGPPKQTDSSLVREKTESGNLCPRGDSSPSPAEPTPCVENELPKVETEMPSSEPEQLDPWLTSTINVEETNDWLRCSVSKFLDEVDGLSPVCFEQGYDLRRQCTDIQDRIKTIASELLSVESHHALQSLRSEVGSAFDRLSVASTKLETCQQIERAISDFDHEAEKLLRILCTEPPSCTVPELNEKIVQLDSLVNLMDDKLSVVNSCCESYKWDHKLADQISTMTARRDRCVALGDLRKLKIHQMIQLATCEQDVSKVVSWVRELAVNMGQCDPCTKVTKFEDVSRKLAEYGNQLCEVSLLLRRSLRLEVSAQGKLQEQLLTALREFDNAAHRCKYPLSKTSAVN